MGTIDEQLQGKINNVVESLDNSTEMNILSLRYMSHMFVGGSKDLADIEWRINKWIADEDLNKDGIEVIDANVSEQDGYVVIWVTARYYKDRAKEDKCIFLHCRYNNNGTCNKDCPVRERGTCYDEK